MIALLFSIKASHNLGMVVEVMVTAMMVVVSNLDIGVVSIITINFAHDEFKNLVP